MGSVVGSPERVWWQYCQVPCFGSIATPSGGGPTTLPVSLVVALVASLAILLSACAPAKQDNPSVQVSAVGFTLHLPPAMQQALDAQAPGFRAVPSATFRSDVSQAAAEAGGGIQALSALVGDFDGDGTTDAVVEGTATGDSSLVVIAILNRARPVAMEVTRFATYDADAVGIYLSKPPAGSPGAFSVVNYPDATTTYAFRDGRFEAQ